MKVNKLIKKLKFQLSLLNDASDNADGEIHERYMMRAEAIEDSIERLEYCQKPLDWEELKKKLMARIMSLPKRTQDSIRESLSKKGKSFVSIPGDKMVVAGHRNMLSSSLTILLINEEREENVWFSIDNSLPAWKWLKAINEVEAREVVYKVDDDPEIPFENSAPYKYRFN